jgi:membrane-associated protein
MPDLALFIEHWGYIAIFVVVVLGNVGLPLPEETVLAIAGYLAWRGDMHVPMVIAVGIVSAVAGDNLGYWLGRRFGRQALPRYAAWMLGHPERLSAMESFVARRGPLAVVVARFLPGIRFLAAPLAGGLGMRFTPFFTANVLGAVAYVPTVVAAGYAIGYGLGPYLDRVHRTVGEAERVIVVGVTIAALAMIAWRAVLALRGRRAS